MRLTKCFKKAALYGALLVFATSCAKTDDTSVKDGDSNILQSAISQVNSLANATENGSLTLQSTNDDFHSMAACSNASFSCTSAVKTIVWGSCTTGFGAVLTGGWVENYSTPACCASNGNGCSVTRVASPSTITYIAGSKLVTSSETHAAYDGTTINGSSGLTSFNSGGIRSMNINGIHRVLSNAGGTIWFDHSLRTAMAINATGSRAGGNRVINSGVVEVFHNTGFYKATVTFSTTNKVTWSDSVCCYPKSGALSAVFTGARTGTANLTFTATCGTAEYSDSNGASGSIILNACE